MKNITFFILFFMLCIKIQAADIEQNYYFTSSYKKQKDSYFKAYNLLTIHNNTNYTAVYSFHGGDYLIGYGVNENKINPMEKKVNKIIFHSNSTITESGIYRVIHNIHLLEENNSYTNKFLTCPYSKEITDQKIGTKKDIHIEINYAGKCIINFSNSTY